MMENTKQTPETSEPCGVLIVDKPQGMTSHDVVGKVRRLFGTRRVGHTGTLDPMATGVLVVLVGRAAKAAEYLSCDRKHYLAMLRLGLTTDTEDVTGTVLSESGTLPPASRVLSALDAFRGDILQTPPMYSALKIDGQKLYDLARKGQTVERSPRPITVYRLEGTPLTDSDYSLDVICSAGTYIRTLCADIGAALGCGGVMAALRRVEAGGFTLSQALTLETLEAMPAEQRPGTLLPVASLFSDLPQVRLPAFYERLCRNGCAVAQKKIGLDTPLDARVRVSDASGRFFALGQTVTDENGQPALKLIKLFSL